MAVATDYLGNVDERTNSSCVNSILEIFSFDTFFSFE
jgi:hypothetical protein